MTLLQVHHVQMLTTQACNAELQWWYIHQYSQHESSSVMQHGSG
jgi:hypothetical protein